MLLFRETWPLNYIASVILSISVFLTKYGANSRIMLQSEMLEELKRFQIIPDVFSEGPQQYLTVSYMDGKTLEFGNMMDPHDMRERPILVKWDWEEDEVYTLIFVDADKKLEGMGEYDYQHWLVVNIKGPEVLKGLVVVPYVRPRPAKNSGVHRFVYVLYRQYNGTQAFSMAPIKDDPLNLSPRRGNFSVSEFARRNHLGSPLAMNFFQAIWTPRPTFRPDTAKNSGKKY